MLNNNKRKNSYSKERIESKSSLVNKVNTKDKKRKPSQKAKSSLQNKVNSNYNSNQSSSPKYQSRFRKSFFFRLSIIGRIMFSIYAISIVIFLGLFIQAFMQKGHIIYGERQNVKKNITNEQVNKVKDELVKEIKDVDSIDVSYLGYRFVVVIDMKKEANLDKAKEFNNKAYSIITKVLPANDYFYSKDVLNNDLYIYSTDVVPTNYETKSKVLYETYQNSKMSKPESNDLLTARNEDSAKEVIETMEKAKNNK